MSLIVPIRRKTPSLHGRTSLFKYATAETARIVLATRKLRWSSPIIFNDPFDVPINLELPFERADLQSALVKRIADAIEHSAEFKHPKLIALSAKLRAHPEYEAKKNEILEDFRNWPKEGIELPTLEKIQAHWERLRPDMRILCLSEKNDVGPMWANYADRHKGVVMEFVDHPNLDSVLAVARPVTYSPLPPRLPGMEEWIDSILKIKPLDLTELFADYQYKKGEHWAYEHEWRLATYKRNVDAEALFSDWPFHPLELAALYLGPRMPDNEAREFEKFLRYGFEHVRLYKGIEDQKTLKIAFVPFKC